MAWDLLFTSDIGLLSLATIAFMIVMVIYLARYAMRHAADEIKAQDQVEGKREVGAH